MLRSKFSDRRQAGRELAEVLQRYAGRQPIVLALPRGGVPVGYEVARALRAPLDVCVVRKIGLPWQPELGLGAVAEGGHVYVDHDLVRRVGISSAELTEAIEAKRLEVEERVKKFRRGRALPNLCGRTVLMVDDGIATGGTTRAAIASIRQHRPEALVLAVPVAEPAVAEELESEVDDLVVLLAPAALHAIGLWYDDFEQVSDAQVIACLERAAGQSWGGERAAVDAAKGGQ
jgi:putative phosphoribosyl transferase